jgi:hypothetical protein
MMIAADTPAQIFRMRESFEGKSKPKGYKKTRRFLDEARDRTIYACDIVGHVVRSRIGSACSIR